MQKRTLFTLIAMLGVTLTQAQPNVLTYNSASLIKAKQELKSNTPAAKVAYDRVLKDAAKALKVQPMTVMDKKQNPPSGDRHDYVSLAPYWWPNPDTKNGLPYVRRDGERNPEIKDYEDKNYFPKVGNNVKTLALAYYLSGDEKYAEHAAKILRTWFLNKNTRMNPNMNYAQAVKGRSDGRGAGLIEARPLGDVVNAVGMLQGSKAWTVKDRAELQAWMTEFLGWMQTSKIGLDEKKSKNNHGVYYDSQRLALALFVDDKVTAADAIASAKHRIDAQQDSLGGFPDELGRTCSWNYSHFIMEAFYEIASMSEKAGEDLWNYTSPNGKSLKKAAYFLLSYWSGNPWTYDQIASCKDQDATELMLLSYKHFGDEQFLKYAQRDYANSPFFATFELAYK